MIVNECIRFTGLLVLLYYGCKPSELVNLLSNKTIIPKSVNVKTFYLPTNNTKGYIVQTIH